MENRFDKIASDWDKKPDRIILAEKFASEIRQVTQGKNYKTVLDYGCGTGNVSFFLKDYFEKLTLADASQGMLDEVRNKISQNDVKHFTPLLLDLEKSDCAEKFDVIYTLMTLHHIKNIEKVIEKFRHMLSPDGMLIIGDLDKEDGDFHRYPENQEVHFGFEKEFMSKILNEENFDIDTYKIFHEMERTHTGIAKSYPLFFRTSLLNPTENQIKSVLLYDHNDRKIMKIAEDSLNPKIDRINEIIAYAKEAKLNSVGIANCISFNKQAELLTNLLQNEGFKVDRVHCKYGRVPFANIVEGYKGISCNPAGQAEYLAQKGTQLNIMMGLCLGHDMIFNAKSKAPVTPLVVKDRKENHNTVKLLSKNKKIQKSWKKIKNKK